MVSFGWWSTLTTTNGGALVSQPTERVVGLPKNMFRCWSHRMSLLATLSLLHVGKLCNGSNRCTSFVFGQQYHGRGGGIRVVIGSAPAHHFWSRLTWAGKWIFRTDFWTCMMFPYWKWTFPMCHVNLPDYFFIFFPAAACSVQVSDKNTGPWPLRP